MLNYLVVEDFSGCPVPFLFPPKVNHEDMREQLPYGKIISGGIVQGDLNTLVCRDGCSIPGVKARPQEDALLIAASLADSR